MSLGYSNEELEGFAVAFHEIVELVAKGDSLAALTAASFASDAAENEVIRHLREAGDLDALIHDLDKRAPQNRNTLRRLRNRALAERGASNDRS